MNGVKVIEIKKSVFAENEKDADALRVELKNKGVCLLNLMSAPGSGKTTTLIYNPQNKTYVFFKSNCTTI